MWSVLIRSRRGTQKRRPHQAPLCSLHLRGEAEVAPLLFQMRWEEERMTEGVLREFAMCSLFGFNQTGYDNLHQLLMRGSLCKPSGFSNPVSHVYQQLPRKAGEQHKEWGMQTTVLLVYVNLPAHSRGGSQVRSCSRPLLNSH